MLNVLWVDCEFIIIETEPLLKNIAALYSKLNFSKMKQKSGNYKGDCLQKWYSQIACLESGKTFHKKFEEYFLALR